MGARASPPGSKRASLGSTKPLRVGAADATEHPLLLAPRREPHLRRAEEARRARARHGNPRVCRAAPRTVYTITVEGRRALRRWLAEPGGAPVVEFEGLVKVLFAEQAGKRELVATLGSIRAEAEDTKHHHAELTADLMETGGPFPHRLHVNALVFKFMWEQTEMLLRWVTWAEQEVAHWPDDASNC